MCGIAGICNFNYNYASQIKKMNPIQRHRGPDSEGYFYDKKNKISLGMTRLAIIGLSSGMQPQYSNDKKIVLVFNGEIFNYLELKEELKDNYPFKTGTDTEVIIAAYEKW